MTLDALKAGGKRDIARTLSRLDREYLADDDVALLDAAFHAPQGLVIGLTGPPGVGKSTLTQGLLEHVRRGGRSVGVIAIDPSSQTTGGALLGDRTRLSLNPDDRHVFVRSLAARNRLGGLSDHAIAATMLLRALFDVVLVETVGIGQSDSDIALIADRSVVCIQPGSGDALQFMKAGIMEWPDVICVTKADMGKPAQRAFADVEGALGLASFTTDQPTVFLISAKTGHEISPLAMQLTRSGSLSRQYQPYALVKDAVQRRFGTFGAENCDIASALEQADGPFGAIAQIRRVLEETP
ncbi:MAG: methylmalonyl Co-A mutase-associated GTPase MeaB [Pseudomonadota bacterium]